MIRRAKPNLSVNPDPKPIIKSDKSGWMVADTPRRLRERFIAACKLNGVTAIEALTPYMEAYITDTFQEENDKTNEVAK